MFGRRKVAVVVAEFLGTGILTLLILSVQRSTIGVPFFVALSAGLAYALMTLVFTPVSGAFFNPVATLALALGRLLNVGTALVYIIAQFLGARAAVALYVYFSGQALQPVPGHFIGRIMAAEALGTGILVLVLAAIKHRQTSTISSQAGFAGLAYTVGVVAASSASIGILNPAIALSELGSHNWVWMIYVLGPVLGGLIGYSLYQMLFIDSIAGIVTANAAVGRTSTSAAAAGTNAVATKTVVKRVEKPITKSKAGKALATKKPGPKRKTTAKRK
jgi:glycerol uptake facilitator-like aquaporin